MQSISIKRLATVPGAKGEELFQLSYEHHNSNGAKVRFIRRAPMAWIFQAGPALIANCHVHYIHIHNTNLEDVTKQFHCFR